MIPSYVAGEGIGQAPTLVAVISACSLVNSPLAIPMFEIVKPVGVGVTVVWSPLLVKSEGAKINRNQNEGMTKNFEKKLIINSSIKFCRKNIFILQIESY